MFHFNKTNSLPNNMWSVDSKKTEWHTQRIAVSMYFHVTETFDCVFEACLMKSL